MIEVAGIQVPRHAMIEVAHRLVLAGETEATTRVLDALAHHDRVTPDINDREAILRALEDCPDALAQLRAVLLTEHVGHQRDGLAEPIRPLRTNHDRRGLCARLPQAPRASAASARRPRNQQPPRLSGANVQATPGRPASDPAAAPADDQPMTILLRHWRHWLSPAARQGRQLHRAHAARLAEHQARREALQRAAR